MAVRKRGASSRRSCVSASRFMGSSGGGWKRKKPQPGNAGWGFLNEVGGLTRQGGRQASKWKKGLPVRVGQKGWTDSDQPMNVHLAQKLRPAGSKEPRASLLPSCVYNPLLADVAPGPLAAPAQTPIRVHSCTG